MIPLFLPENPIPDRVSIAGTAARIPPNTRRTYARLEGPGCIRHIWLVISRDGPPNRKCILRIYFDDADVPHVEAPVGDFFGVMHGEKSYPINTRWLSVKAETGYNCYFAMPFARSARFELESGDERLGVYLMIDWHRYPGQELVETRRFCSGWRREFPTPRYGSDFLALDAEGPGDFIGFVYGMRLYDDTDRWSHGGADQFYGDGETQSPFYLRGIGGEDTFGTSYGGALHTPETHLYAGMPYYHHADTGEARVAQRIVGYRFFEADSVHFKRSLHFRFGCMANDICATTYWYQHGTPRPFSSMPKFAALMPGVELHAGVCDLPLPQSGSWWLCGPFTFAGGPMFLSELACERDPIRPAETIDVHHEPGSAYLGDRAKSLGRDRAHWVRASALRGFVDFNHYYRCAARGVVVTHPATAVARCVLRSPRPCGAKFSVSWDDQALLRVNGEPAIDLGEQSCFRTRDIQVRLREGENSITLKLSNTPGTNHGGWAFAFRCETDDGAVLLPEAPPDDR